MATFSHSTSVYNCVVVCAYVHYIRMSHFLHTGNGIVKVGQALTVSINTLVFMYDIMFTGVRGCLCVHVTVCLSMCVCVFIC